MIENLLLWSIYILPLLMLIRKFGCIPTGIAVGATLFLYTSIPLPSEKDVENFSYSSSRSTYPSTSTVILASQKNKKKFNLALHRKLEKKFPDWEARINYQKKQERFYKSALKKQTELKKMRMKSNPSVYSKEELDAIAYFHGTGFYKNEQNPLLNPKPSIYDTRQTFLLKVHNPEVREKFLNSFHRLKNFK